MKAEVEMERARLMAIAVLVGRQISAMDREMERLDQAELFRSQTERVVLESIRAARSKEIMLSIKRNESKERPAWPMAPEVTIETPHEKP